MLWRSSNSHAVTWVTGAALGISVMVATPAHASPLRMAQNPHGYCDPCQPAPMITGAAPGTEVRLVREALTPEGWWTVFEGVIGVADAEGRLSATVPARTGVYRSYVVAAGQRSNTVYFEFRHECAPPIECAGPGGPGPVPPGVGSVGAIGPIRVTLAASELRPREPQTIFVEQAGPQAWLLLVRQRFNGWDWETVLSRDLGPADAEGRLLDVEPAAELGLFRDIVRDQETGISSDAVLYEVRPRP